MLSLKLAEKLNRRFAQDPAVDDVQAMLETSTSLRAFTTQHEATKHLAEGALLNINRMVSKALSIPHGEYMVWATDAGHTMLVPIASRKPTSEVFEHDNRTYDILTPHLLNHWNGLEKVLAEELPPPNSMGPDINNEPSPRGGMPSGRMPSQAPEPEMTAAPEGEPGDSEQSPEGMPDNQFKSRINMSTVDRTPIVRAMQQQGYTVTSLATACGVDPPAISRILRTPRDTPGDPGGRNPSLGLAAKIAHVLRVDVESAFPDIFNAPRQNLNARETPGNRGSGMKNHAQGTRKKGDASKKWTQGNNGKKPPKPPMESVISQIGALIE